MIVPVLSGSFMLCDYGKLIKENGFDSIFFMYMEDVDLSRRMYKHGNYFYPEIQPLEANTDMPETILQLYNEAGSIYNKSPNSPRSIIFLIFTSKGNDLSR